MDFVLTAVDNALFQAKPEIWNSDQGSHFTSPKYLERLQREEIKISMDGRGRAMDKSSLKDCGVPSNTRKFICMNTSAQRRLIAS